MDIGRECLEDQRDEAAVLSGHAGAVEETTRFDAFGTPLDLQTPGTGNDLLFTGREYDRATGLYYYRARHYDPEIGRFLAEDPIGFEGGINLYAYARNNPLRFNDPTGRQAFGDELLIDSSLGPFGGGCLDCNIDLGPSPHDPNSLITADQAPGIRGLPLFDAPELPITGVA